MRIYTIYLATNLINGKQYVGFDSAWPNRRNDHNKKAFCTNRCYRSLLHDAIRKYGKEKFEWAVLYQSTDGTHTKDVMENYFIVTHRTFVGFSDCNGYNLTLGGDGNLGRRHSSESIAKLSRNKTGKLTAKSKRVTTPRGAFESLAAATSAFKSDGVSKGAIHKRIVSPYFPDWYYTDSPKHNQKKPQPYQSRRIVTPAGEFPSIAEAARSMGLLENTIRYRLNNPNAPDWAYLN